MEAVPHLDKHLAELEILKDSKEPPVYNIIYIS